MSSSVHGRRRDRALLQTLLAGAGLQITVVLAGVLSLPFVARALPPEEFGVYATVTGFIALLGFADLGIGSALTDRLAAAMGRDTAERQERLVSNAVAGVTMAATAVMVLGIALTVTVPWQSLLGAPSIAESTLQASVLALTVSTAVSIVGATGQRVLFGLQRGSVANNWLIAGTIAGALSTVAVALGEGPLWSFVAATSGVPALVGLICTAWALLHRYPGLRPRRRSVSWSDLRDLAGISGWFFAIAVASAAAYQTDSLVVAAILGASSAGIYSVAMRLFGLVTQTLYSTLLQLWPAFAEALGRDDWDWIRSRYRRSVILAASFAAAGGVALVLIGPALVSLWLTPDLEPPRGLLITMAVWAVYSSATSPSFYLLNAVGRVRAHGVMAVSAAVANLPVSILLTHVIGISGPVLGSLVTHAAFAGIPATLMARRILRGLGAERRHSTVEPESREGR